MVEKETKKNKEKAKSLKPSMSDYMAGEAGSFISDLTPYLPTELVGGSVPYIAGHEEEAVWNAASQACATEKIHFTYTVGENRCWYIACPSSVLSSHPDSWCPVAAALPGNSEYWDRETVYLYEQEGTASALRWDEDTGRMQVFLGATRTLLPRIQSLDANFVTINPDMADIVPWRNRALMTEKMSRVTARILLFSGLFVVLALSAFLTFQYFLTGTVQRNLVKVKQDTDRVAQKLMIDAYNALQSDTIKHMVRIQELLDELKAIDGTLVKYEVDGKKLVWEVLVPSAYGQGVGTLKGKVQPGIESDGRVRIRGTR